MRPSLISAQTTPTSVQERAALQAELDRIERDIANNQGALGGLRERRTTLERDIAILDNKIKTAQLQIKQSDLTLSKLHGDISTKVTAIRQVDTSVSKSQASLAQLFAPDARGRRHSARDAGTFRLLHLRPF